MQTSLRRRCSELTFSHMSLETQVDRILLGQSRDAALRPVRGFLPQFRFLNLKHFVSYWHGMSP